MRTIRATLEQLQLHSSELLEALRTLDNWLKPSSTAHNARSLVETENLCGPVVAAMRHHSSMPRFADQAFLVVHRATLGHARNAESFAQSGAVTEICAILGLHSTDLEVQQNGVQVLDALSCYDTVAQLAVACGAPSTVLRAMRGHPSSPRCTSWAARPCRD